MDAHDAIHFARVDFRNDNRIFGIKDEDRFLHVYVIGKTDTGKSTLIETMALQDLERGNGFALIDPHGDLVARIAARIPASHRDKVIYLNATDPTQPYGYNPLRHVSEDRIALSGRESLCNRDRCSRPKRGGDRYGQQHCCSEGSSGGWSLGDSCYSGWQKGLGVKSMGCPCCRQGHQSRHRGQPREIS
jgi:hypothetical protein